ncbi:HAMP domain-containing sensor histidine kinase [Sulfurimonas sp.]|uniref:sensor histidine kinase n=1 Tax=Sulfurimonas sp. TaxID=2022749 RepID=UPI0026267238|nr:HAMP domain-containing sensor histidine kinase [Sulfurimonas sp.]
MLAEKRSFQRFLFVYVFSSLLLLGFGVWFYYQMSYQHIAQNNINSLKSDIENFIKTNHKNHFIKTGIPPQYNNKKIAIYIDKKFKTGFFKPVGIDFSKEYFIKNEDIYYLHKEHKRWGDVYFITSKNISSAIKNLQKNIIYFMLVSGLFIIAVSFVLGKIFLEPMRLALKNIEDFITDATHEINTPLSNILINIELSKELEPKCAKSEEFKKIENSALRISKLFEDLSFVNLQHKKKQHVEKIAFDQLLKKQIGFFATFIKNKNLHIEMQIEQKELKIDKEDGIRLVDNLLSNAIKYSPLHATITIKLNENYLEIINAGSIKAKEKVIKKFERENKSEGGFGLGLYIVQKICVNYNLRLEIKNHKQKVSVKVFF